MGRREYVQSQQLLLVWVFIWCLCTMLHVQNLSMPRTLKIGALICLNSRMGKSIKMALDLGVEKVNEDPSILDGTKLTLLVLDSNCSALQTAASAMQLMDNGVVAILGPQTPAESDFAAIMSEATRIPLISFSATDPALSHLEYPYLTRVVPSDTMQMAAIAGVIDYYGWKEVVALFTDDDLGRNAIYALRSALERIGSRIVYKFSLHPNISKFGIHKVLVDLNKIKTRVFVVYMQPDLGQTLLSVAIDLGMFNASYFWIVTDDIVSILDNVHLGVASSTELEGIIGIRMYIHPTLKFKYLNWELKKRLGASHNGDWIVSTGAFYAYDALWVVARALESLMNQRKLSLIGAINLKGGIFNVDNVRESTGSMLLNQILETKLSGITGLIELDTRGDRLHSIFEIVNKVGTRLKPVGYWSMDTGCLTIRPPVPVAEGAFNATKRVKGLSLVTWPGGMKIPHSWVGFTLRTPLRIIVPNKAGFEQFVEINVDKHNKTIASGFCIDVFRTALLYLPYNVSFTFTAFGTGQSTPIYDDLIQKVANKEFDAAIGDITITTKRSEMVQFTQPFLDSGLVVVVPKILSKSSSIWQFLRPFSISMWASVGAFSVFTGVVICILEQRTNANFQGQLKKQIATSLWFMLSTLFFTHREKVISVLGRAVLLIWLYVVLIIMASYTANLTSILTNEKLRPTVDGIYGLISSSVPIGYQGGSFARDYLLALGVAKERLIPLNTVQNYTTALLNGPQRGGVAAIVDELPNVELLISQRCDFEIVGQEFYQGSWGFAFQKGLQVAHDITTVILNLTQNGELQHIHDKWIKNSTCKTSEEMSSSLGLPSFSGLFVITGLVSTFVSIVYCFQLAGLFLDVRRTDDTFKPPEGLSKRERFVHFIKSFAKFVSQGEIPRERRKEIRRLSNERKREKRREKYASKKAKSRVIRSEDSSVGDRFPSFDYRSDIEDQSVNPCLHGAESLP